MTGEAQIVLTMPRAVSAMSLALSAMSTRRAADGGDGAACAGLVRCRLPLP